MKKQFLNRLPYIQSAAHWAGVALLLLAGTRGILGQTAAIPTVGKLEPGKTVSAVAPVEPTSSPSIQSLDAKPLAANDVAQPSKVPGREGISLSGWWVIDVKNPDGKIVTHREFENNITGSGNDLLVHLLAGADSIAGPVLQVGANPVDSGPSPCGSGGCWIFSNSNLYGSTPICASTPAACSDALTTTIVPDPAAAQNDLRLSGSIVATKSGYIDVVQSIYVSCHTLLASTPIDISPQACATAGAGSISATEQSLASRFTIASLPTLNVSAGQTVQITVTFSFVGVSNISAPPPQARK